MPQDSQSADHFTSRFLRVTAVVFLMITGANSFGQAHASGKIHTYYIAADNVIWDYTPNGRNVAGVQYSDVPDEYTPSYGHRTYPKAQFREYADASFRDLKPAAAEWAHLGILGPVLRAEVGDTVEIIFKNNTKRSCGLLVQGLAKVNVPTDSRQGEGISSVVREEMVPSGEVRAYKWEVPERSGPSAADPSSVVWMYYGHYVEAKDANTGLLGPVIITARGMSKANGAPRDVDHEFVTAFAVFDETASWYWQEGKETTASHTNNYVGSPDRTRNMLYSINGFVEGNLPMLTMKKGERVRWYLLANANQDDVHAIHWQGETVLYRGSRTDTVPLNPMGTAVVDMAAENTGTWLLSCQVNHHFKGGMQARFTVLP